MYELVASIERTTHALGIALGRRLAKHKLSQAEVHVLAFLGRHTQATVGELHAGFGHRRSTLTGVLDRLEAAGLVKRWPHPDDRRAILVIPTAQGRSVADAALAAVVDLEKRVEKRVAKRDLEGFRRVIAAVEEETR